MRPPLLLIDVDGPLNPYAANPNRRPAGYQTHRMRPTGWENPRVKPLRVWLNPDHGPALRALPYDLVWCTTWEHEANTWIGPHLGLPELPAITFDKSWRLPTRGDGTYFKTHEAAAYVAGRPFAWIDDEISQTDEEYIHDVHGPHAMLRKIDPAIGLTGDDFTELRDWSESLTEIM